MAKLQNSSSVNLKIYKGYGHTHHLVVYGHLLQGNPTIRERFTQNIFYNTRHLIRLFSIDPIPDARIRLQHGTTLLETHTKDDGFFEFHWESPHELVVGVQSIQVAYLDSDGNVIQEVPGELYIPHSVQLAVISDIDDTILISYSSRFLKRLRVLFTRQPHSRKTFVDIVHYFTLLSKAHTTPDLPNPFFYVSSSEWNLYDDLTEFFSHNQLPEGVLLLNKIKRLQELGASGQTQHHNKLVRIERIMRMFPKQRFVLYGDNSQQDPTIYVSIAKQFPQSVVAIYIRCVQAKKKVATKRVLAELADTSIHTLLFEHTREAMLHSASVGLLPEDALPSLIEQITYPNQ
jgi:phosphatidate phosphatase APP1